MRCRGFTLIELLIALAIFIFLIMLAGPMYANLMGNSKIRNAAENTLTGVRLAQTLAVKSNRPVKFVVDTSAGGGWAVYAFDENLGDFALTPSQSYLWADGAAATSVTTQPAGASQLTFSGLGRVIANADASATLSEIDVTNSNVPLASRRPLHVVVSALSAPKLCDPNVLAPDPRACP
jgi:type IV fimbrial biogenesis protein FimU